MQPRPNFNPRSRVGSDMSKATHTPGEYRKTAQPSLLRANTAILTNMPQLVQLVFGGSGIVPAAIVAIVLNVVLPKDEK